MKTLKEQLAGRCKHYTGIRTIQCKAGMIYDEVMQVGKLGISGCMRRLPCLSNKYPEILPCEKYETFTEDEINEHIKASKRRENLLSKNLSPCCESPIDHSQVIKKGIYKGHGGRYCSKCKKVVFWV